mmetsp:Transcript_15353/g.26875  ORF Transcript_15353/g.26875 Transcript_15353/m.26875 type:complete len:321 (-) Transcript_15353:748-1710(-)
MGKEDLGGLWLLSATLSTCGGEDTSAACCLGLSQLPVAEMPVLKAAHSSTSDGIHSHAAGSSAFLLGRRIGTGEVSKNLASLKVPRSDDSRPKAAIRPLVWPVHCKAIDSRASLQNAQALQFLQVPQLGSSICGSSQRLLSRPIHIQGSNLFLMGNYGLEVAPLTQIPELQAAIKRGAERTRSLPARRHCQNSRGRVEGQFSNLLCICQVPKSHATFAGAGEQVLQLGIAVANDDVQHDAAGLDTPVLKASIIRQHFGPPKKLHGRCGCRSRSLEPFLDHCDLLVGGHHDPCHRPATHGAHGDLECTFRHRIAEASSPRG